MDGNVVQEFIEAIKEPQVDTNKTYIAAVSRIDNEGVVWVHVQGSEKETPTELSAAEVKAGDTVNVEWRNNKLYIANNVSNPSVGVMTVAPAVDYINLLEGKDISVNSIEAATGYIDELYSKNITTDSLVADHAMIKELDVESMSAATAYIRDLTSENITADDIIADHATVGTIAADYVSTGDLEAVTGRIDNLEANELVVNDNLKANNASIEYLESDWVSTDRLVLTGNNKNNYPPVQITESEFNVNKTAYWTKSGDTYTQCTSSSVYDPDEQYYVRQTVKSIIEAINTANNTDPQVIVSNDKLIASSMDVAELSAITADMGTLTAGKIQKGNNFINLNTSPASMEFKNASTWAGATQGLQFDTQGNLNIKGKVTVVSGSNVPTTTEMNTAIGTATTDMATNTGVANTYATKSAANGREQTIYKSAAAGTTSMSGTTTWVTSTSNSQNAWTTKRPSYSQSYPVLFVATQRQTVAQSSGTTCSCTTPMIDDTTTIIDGGNIITGTVTANKLDAADINASNSLTIGALSTSTQDDILNSKTNAGANVAPYPYFDEALYGNPWTSNGITWTVNADGSITATGTATANSWYHISANYNANLPNGEYCIPAGTYTLSGCPSGGSASTYELNIDTFDGTAGSTSTGYYNEVGNGVTFTIASKKYVRIQMLIASGVTCPSGGYTFYPMLESGSIKHKFVSPKVNEGASQTATKYITRISNTGIQIHPTDSSGNDYAQIDGSNIQFFRNGVSMTGMTDTDVRIGRNDAQHARINSSGMTIYNGSESDATNLANFGSTVRIGKPSGASKLTADSNGIFLHGADGTERLGISSTDVRIGNGSTPHVRINSSGMTIYKGAESNTANNVANYSDSVRIGALATTNIQLIATGADAGIKFYAKDATSLTRVADIGFNTNSGYTTEGPPTSTWYTLGWRTGTYNGYYSLVTGFNCIASNNASVACGIQSTAFGPISLAFGHNCRTGVSSQYSGSSDEGSYGWGSAAIGSGCVAEGNVQIAIGEYNKVDTTSVFIVGGGSTSVRKNALKLTRTGNMTIAGTLTQSSDRRLKTHKRYLGEDAIEFIKKLKPAFFSKDESNHVGFYAQDVEAIDKWHCMVGEMNGFKTLGYTELIAPLVTYCQHLEERIKVLEGGI